MKHTELTAFKALFVVAAIWNLAGGILGYFNTAHAFELLFDRELVDPLFYGVYQGACGTTLVYFVGYFIVAYDPLKHAGIVVVGGIGKIGFAVQLLRFYFAGVATSHAFVVIIGDFVFSALFLYYFWRVFRTRGMLVWANRVVA